MADSSLRRRLLAATCAGAVVAPLAPIAAPIVGAAPASAGGQDATLTDLRPCETRTVCTFRLAGLDVTTGTDVTVARDERGDVVLRGALSLGGAAGWTIAESELAFAADGDLHRYVGGSARFADLESPVLDLVDLPYVALGIADGAELADAGAHVPADGTFWYFTAAAGASIAPGSLLDGTAFEFRPVPIPVSASITFVLDPSDPYAYLGGSCDVISAVAGSLTGKRRDDGAGDTADGEPTDGDTADGIVAGDESTTGRTDVHEADEGSDGGSEHASEQPPRTVAQIAADALEYVAGDCGLGFSGNGRIPAPGIAGTTPYGAHVVVDAPVPAPLGTSIAGSTTMRFDDGLRMTGVGDVSLGVAPLGELLGASLPLGSAGVDIEVSADRIGVAAEGLLATQDGYELPLLRDPVRFPADAHVHVAARFGTVPGVGIDPASFVQFDGALSLLGTSLADAMLRVDRTGASVEGMMTTGVTTYEVAGRLSAEGADVTARAQIDLPLDRIGEAADATIAAVEEAQADVDLLEIEMRSMRSTIGAERQAATDDLADARRDVAAASASLATIDRNIAVNDSKIRYLSKRISNERRSYRRLPWYKRARYAARHSARIGAWSAAIGGLRVANAANAAARDTARVGLGAAQSTLRGLEQAIDATPIDADPRMIGLLTAHGTATAVLSATEAAARPFRFTTSYHGAVALSLGTSAVGGSFEAIACGLDGCTTLAAGSIRVVDGRTVGCVVVAPGTAEVCAPL